MNSLRLLDFTFDDELINDQDTLLGTLAMLMDLKLHEHFNVEYQVYSVKYRVIISLINEVTQNKSVLTGQMVHAAITYLCFSQMKQ